MKRSAARPPFFASASTWVILLATSACATPDHSRLSRLAANANVAEQIVNGEPFRHRLFANEFAITTNTGPLLVFIEGDGSPWINGGRVPAADPTARQPLAFQLFLETRQPALYITRPCYEGLNDDGCNPDLWTTARYSNAVVDSLAAALRGVREMRGNRQLLLIGYSGGGVLATLLASRLPDTAGVITIAANLDVAAWTRLHGYLPLTDSLDPAREPAGASIARVALVGGRDAKVPPATIAGYLAAHPDVAVISFAEFDHVCCWQREWQVILPRALQQLLHPSVP